MTWKPGRDKIRQLIDGGELERVQVDKNVARRLLADAERHAERARSVAAFGELAGAYQLAQDAMRECAASLPAVQGLRATEAAMLRFKFQSLPSSELLLAHSSTSAEFGVHATDASTPMPRP